MEILGLAIVVVLILMATIFVVRFLVLKTPIDHRAGFVSSETASNMLNTFLRTNAKDCSQLDMTGLLQDCAQGKGVICGNGQDSCEFVESSAKKIFESTIDKWNSDYEFLAYIDLDSPLITIGKPCRAEKRSKLFPIPISASTMYVQLDICG